MHFCTVIVHNYTARAGYIAVFSFNSYKNAVGV